MEQRRVLLAFLLMAVVLAFSQWWYGRLQPEADSVAPADTVATAPPAEPEPEPTVEDGDLSDTKQQPDTTGAPIEADRGAPTNELLSPGAAASPVVVETPLYTLTIDPQGGSIRQAELIQYPSFTESGPVTLVPDEGVFLQRAADLSGERIVFSEYQFAASEPALRLAPGGDEQTLVLEFQSGSERIVQEYRFTPDSYVVDYRLSIGLGGDGLLVTGLGPRLRSNEKKPRDDYGQNRAVARVDGEIFNLKAKDVDESATALNGVVDWAGLKSKYFLALLLAPPDSTPLSGVTVTGAMNDTLPTLDVAIGSPIRGGESGYRIFLGPQEYERLSALNEGLDNVNQYGWSWIRWMITPFAKLSVVVMLWLHQFIPSYGLVLIVFGLLIRVLTWPLTTKSYHSIRAMQKLQPEIQRIREQYKDDPQRMQQETMGLYREKKVNPLGGCLPQLIPMPILFALFFVFQGTIEFRGAPFLWIPDLSQPDPLYILPIFMGITMFGSSKLTATDPKMASMVYVMPLVLTFVFINLAAGLVLYYSFSNVLTFGQQWWLKQSTDREEEESQATTAPPPPSKPKKGKSKKS